MEFWKGHGTGNDFVVLPDVDGRRPLSPPVVRALCDRRFGVGGDGVLRVVRSAADPDGAAMAAEAEFFMDYRNADGSLAAMCGNGARVFARFLVSAGLVPAGEFAFGTRGGVRLASVAPTGDVSIDMGPVAPQSGRTGLAVRTESGRWPAMSVFVPNPHAVAFVADVGAAGGLATAPVIEPAAYYPDGANVEFVERIGPGHIRMRVHERGAGETLSCGTGACAAAWAVWRADGPGDHGAARMRVDVPGGTVDVHRDEHDRLHLSGPAVLVAHGTVDLDALLEGGRSRP